MTEFRRGSEVSRHLPIHLAIDEAARVNSTRGPLVAAIRLLNGRQQPDRRGETYSEALPMAEVIVFPRS